MTEDKHLLFQKNGYLILRSVLDPVVDFAGVIAAYDRVLDRLEAPVSDLPPSVERVCERVTTLYQQSGSLFSQHFDFTLPPRANLPADLPLCLEPEIFELLTHPALLDAIEPFIGPEIAVNPVCHTRLKPPEHLLGKASANSDYRSVNINNENGMMVRTPWHQDNAVYTPDADNVNILTVWFPISDASIENGCLQVIPGSHRQGLRGHCPSNTSDLKIPPALVRETATPLPMRPGDVLLLNKRTVHSSLPNKSESARWSFDLRYQTAGQANGRNVLPSFIARSAKAPENIMTSPEAWAALWRDTREHLSQANTVPPANRWSADAPMCA